MHEDVKMPLSVALPTDVLFDTRLILATSESVQLEAIPEEPLETAVQTLLAACRVARLNAQDIYFWVPGAARNPDLLSNPFNERAALLYAHQVASSGGLAATSLLSEIQLRIDAFCAPANVVPMFRVDLSNPVQFSSQATQLLASLNVGLEIRERQVDGRGVYAKMPVKAGANAFEAPYSSVISLLSALKDPVFGPLATELLTPTLDNAPLDQDAVLVLYLIHLHHSLCNTRDGEESGMAPAEFQFKHSGLDLSLEPSNLYAFPHEIIASFGDQVEAHVAGILQVLHELLARAGTILQGSDCYRAPSFKEFLAVKAFLDSRAFSVQLTPAHICTSCPEDTDQQLVEVGGCTVRVPKRLTCFVPVADFFNHHPAAQCGAPRFDVASNTFIIPLAADVPTGAQVYLNYGGLQSFEFMMFYGFLPSGERNWADVVRIELTPPEDAEALIRLEMEDISLEHALRHGNSCEALSWRLLRAVQIIAGIDDNAEECFQYIDALLDAIELPALDTAEGAPWRLYGDLVKQYRLLHQNLLTANRQRLVFARDMVAKRRRVGIECTDASVGTVNR